jgi:hypothetical protein
LLCCILTLTGADLQELLVTRDLSMRTYVSLPALVEEEPESDGSLYRYKVMRIKTPSAELFVP